MEKVDSISVRDLEKSFCMIALELTESSTDCLCSKA